MMAGDLRKDCIRTYQSHLYILFPMFTDLWLNCVYLLNCMAGLTVACVHCLFIIAYVDASFVRDVQCCADYATSICREFIVQRNECTTDWKGLQKYLTSCRRAAATICPRPDLQRKRAAAALSQAGRAGPDQPIRAIQPASRTRRPPTRCTRQTSDRQTDVRQTDVSIIA